MHSFLGTDVGAFAFSGAFEARKTAVDELISGFKAPFVEENVGEFIKAGLMDEENCSVASTSAFDWFGASEEILLNALITVEGLSNAGVIGRDILLTCFGFD